jgi:hypothetical protein
LESFVGSTGVALAADDIHSFMYGKKKEEFY